MLIGLSYFSDLKLMDYLMSKKRTCKHNILISVDSLRAVNECKNERVFFFNLTELFFQFNRAFIVIREYPDPCFDVGGFGYLIHVMFSISLNLIFL